MEETSVRLFCYHTLFFFFVFFTLRSVFFAPSSSQPLPLSYALQLGSPPSPLELRTIGWLSFFFCSSRGVGWRMGVLLLGCEREGEEEVRPNKANVGVLVDTLSDPKAFLSAFCCLAQILHMKETSSIYSRSRCQGDPSQPNNYFFSLPPG